MGRITRCIAALTGGGLCIAATVVAPVGHHRAATALAIITLPANTDHGFGASGSAPGTVAPTLPAGLNGRVDKILPQPDGGVIAGGALYQAQHLWGFWLTALDPFGAPITSFGAGGLVTRQTVVPVGTLTVRNPIDLISDNGRLLVASDGDVDHERIYAYHPDGTPDLTFGPGNTGFADVLPNFTVKGTRVVADSLQRLYVVTFARAAPAGYEITRLTPTGAIDTTYGTAGKAFLATDGISPNSVYAAVTSTDALLVWYEGVQVLVGGFLTSKSLARLRTDGTLDPTFGPGSNGISPVLFGLEPPAALRILPDGTIFAASLQLQFSTIVQSNIAHLDANGNRLASFSLPNELKDLVVRPDNSFDVVMRSFSAGTTTIEVQQYSEAYLPDLTFNAGSATPGISRYIVTTPTIDVGAAALSPNGEVLFGGSLSSVPGDDTPWLTRLFSGQQPFAAVGPSRLMDTRPGSLTVDHQFEGTGKMLRGQRLVLTVGGRAKIPATVAAVVLNVTVIDPDAAGFVTVYPCTAAVPTASNVNFTKGQTVANAVVVRTAALATASVCIYTSQTTHVIVDAASHFDIASAFNALAPARLMETRSGLTTVDGRFNGIGTRTDGSVTELQVTDRAGVPAGAAAAVLNVTATEAIAPGFVTVYDCDSGFPTASSVNFIRGQTTPNLVIAKLSPRGTVCLYTHATTQLVVDVSGVFTDLRVYRPLAPARLMETRAGLTTIDSQYNGIGLRGAGTITELQVAGRGSVPLGVAAAVLNVTVTEPTADGFVTVFPCDGQRPNASNVNFVSGQTIPNAVVAALTPTGTVCIYTHAATQLLVDVSGYFPFG